MTRTPMGGGGVESRGRFNEVQPAILFMTFCEALKETLK